MHRRVLIVGGGAAGYFGSITAAQRHPNLSIVIAEASERPLQKIAISGGGRCNVTNACFDIKELTKSYPRGQRELLGPFSRFQPRDTIEWFSARGVKLKTEEDGRMFPISDSSQTIIDCFEKARTRAKIDLRIKTKVVDLQMTKDNRLKAYLQDGGKTYSEDFDAVLLASGGTKGGHNIAKTLGHKIEPCVPSLFTFEVKDNRLNGLSGVSVPWAELRLSIGNEKTLTEAGPLLVTHWGFSGPAVIKLSAWGAKALYVNNYRAHLHINWCPNEKRDLFAKRLVSFSEANAKRLVRKNPPIQIPKRLWENLCYASRIDGDSCYAELSRSMRKALEEELFGGCYHITGKGVFKDEFVTCGGISLREVDLRTMESKLVSGLFFAGEILDIDGITGGYNFQNAWTTGFIAGSSLNLSP